MKKICVFCSACDNIPSSYFHVAKTAGQMIAKNGYTLVFGGTSRGLMLEVAEAVYNNGGKVISIMPEVFHSRGFWEKTNELIVTKDIEERKEKMYYESDAFLVLPGGFGTIDEVSSIIEAKRAGLNDKPVVLINANNFYRGLITQLNDMYEQNFLKEIDREYYHITDNIVEAFEYIERYLNESVERRSFNPCFSAT